MVIKKENRSAQRLVKNLLAPEYMKSLLAYSMDASHCFSIKEVSSFGRYFKFTTTTHYGLICLLTWVDQDLTQWLNCDYELMYRLNSSGNYEFVLLFSTVLPDGESSDVVQVDMRIMSIISKLSNGDQYALYGLASANYDVYLTHVNRNIPKPDVICE